VFSDQRFLSAITRFERSLAKVLSTLLTAVLVVACLQLVLALGFDLFDLRVNWTGEGLIRLLDEVLVLLIALEVLQNLTAYLRDNVVQIELVLVTALTAVSRKLIVMPPGVHKDPGDLFGLGFAAVALAAAYWLVRQSHVKRRQNSANHRVPGSGSVATTRWRRWGVINRLSPTQRSRTWASSANCRRALPRNTSTHSSSVWSYQNPSGLLARQE
jgi:uncharacterized membrane protein (DUF373 family)